MKCMNEKGLEAYQVKRNLKKLEESLRNKFGVWWECFGRETKKYREREIEEKWFLNRTEALYRASSKSQQVNLDRCRYQEVSRDLSRRCRENARRQLRCREGIEEQHIRIKNRSSIDPPRCREAIEEAGASSIDPPGIEEVSRLR